MRFGDGATIAETPQRRWIVFSVRHYS